MTSRTSRLIDVFIIRLYTCSIKRGQEHERYRWWDNQKLKKESGKTKSEKKNKLPVGGRAISGNAKFWSNTHTRTHWFYRHLNQIDTKAHRSCANNRNLRNLFLKKPSFPPLHTFKSVHLLFTTVKKPKKVVPRHIFLPYTAENFNKKKPRIDTKIDLCLFECVT